MLELDHVLCMVDPEDAWAERLTAAGWELDAGMSHPGQGIRNRRLVLAGHYLELAWIEDRAEARANSLRLDRRADWATTGASPFGIGLRGRLLPEEEPALWLYEDLGFPIWVHRDDADRPGHPLVFVLDLPSRRPAGTAPHAGVLQCVEHRGPGAAGFLRYSGPRVVHRPGRHRLELVVDAGRPVEVTDLLAVRMTDV